MGHKVRSRIMAFTFKVGYRIYTIKSLYTRYVEDVFCSHYGAIKVWKSVEELSLDIEMNPDYPWVKLFKAKCSREELDVYYEAYEVLERGYGELTVFEYERHHHPLVPHPFFKERRKEKYKTRQQQHKRALDKKLSCLLAVVIFNMDGG